MCDKKHCVYCMHNKLVIQKYYVHRHFAIVLCIYYNFYFYYVQTSKHKTWNSGSYILSSCTYYLLVIINCKIIKPHFIKLSHK